MRTILVAIDFSDATEAVVAAANRMAVAFAGRIYLVHVAAPDPEFVGYEAGPQHERDWRARELRHEHRLLETLAEELKQTGVEATALLVQGAAVDKLLDEVNRCGADLVVIGSHGHGRLYELVVGSVAEGVLRKANVPVLVVPAGKQG